MNRFTSLLVILSLFFVSAIGIQAQDQNIVEIASGDENFSTLVTAVQAAGLVDVLADPEAEWTVFAPTNDAFAALPEGALDALLADTELLTRVLTYHVVEGTVTSDMISPMMAPSMEMTAPGEPLMGSELDVQVTDDGAVMINDATVVMADIMATNGVVHVIDKVLIPAEIADMLMGDMMMEEDDMMDDMMMSGTVFGTLNPADLANDAIVTLAGDLSAVNNTLSGFEGITNVQSLDIASDGTVYLSVDVAEGEGGIIIADGLAASESMDMGMDNAMIGGVDAAGIVAPKGIEVIESLDVVLIANFGATNIKGFSLDAVGDVDPTVFINDLGTSGGSVWDILYVEETDTLYAAGTAGDILAYDNFSTDMGATLSRTIAPSNADLEKVTINLHGLAYDAPSDTLIVSDVGAADDATDGHIYAVPNVSSADGNTTVNLHILGPESMLGNPVDILWDGSGLYVAEKANSAFLYFGNLLDMSGMMDSTPTYVLEAANPESLSWWDGMMMDDMMEDDMSEDMMEMGTIVDIAAGDENFSTLVTAVQAAGLVDVLADPNAEWTVFAPTNAAFEALPEGVLDMLLADTELLTRVLTYHVVEGTVTSDMISPMMAPSMEMTAPGEPLMGSELDVQIADDGTVMINNATVVMADIMASNGVIHVIDTVLVPADIAAMISG